MTYFEALFTIEKGSLWRNKKTGNLYEVIGVAEQSEDGTALVIYKRTETDMKKLWARPADIWLDKFEKEYD